ncbi:hypothetical protein J5N97_014240 [Dioscorea zingiberensis]|uniref:RNase H type-1 domain-containing protein n=1 Tax=Dioscorea zingiberensis TaxID=325984 RepID=A0A9D5HJI8_9LILI|nr:hypothetical protein J5N97_014240 [Dioscorea zingiberensis]
MPLLLTSSADPHEARDEREGDDHQMLVDQAEDVLNNVQASQDLSDQSMTDSESSEEEMDTEEPEENSTLEKTLEVTADRIGKSFFLINRPAHGYVCIYSAACWDLNNGKGGAGFCIVDSNACILLAGCSMQANSKMDAGAKAVLIAMEWAYRENYNIEGLLVSCTELWKTMNGQDSEIEWRSHPSITDLRQNWLRHEHLRMDFIPWKWNRMAGSLARHGMNLVSISLFHRGMERPRWLMRMVEAVGFHF